jgi:hypothetical protein
MRERWRILRDIVGRNRRGEFSVAGGNRNQPAGSAAGNAAREYIEAEGVPDLYCDEFVFSHHAMGTAITLVALIPPNPGASGRSKGRIVGRVRMSHQLALDLAKIITEQVGGLVRIVSPEPPPDGPKN